MVSVECFEGQSNKDGSYHHKKYRHDAMDHLPESSETSTRLPSQRLLTAANQLSRKECVFSCYVKYEPFKLEAIAVVLERKLVIYEIKDSPAAPFL
ncbi:hypothetical protein ABKN59_011619 [Abortiporus biennis]